MIASLRSASVDELPPKEELFESGAKAGNADPVCDADEVEEAPGGAELGANALEDAAKMVVGETGLGCLFELPLNRRGIDEPVERDEAGDVDLCRCDEGPMEQDRARGG